MGPSTTVVSVIAALSLLAGCAGGPEEQPALDAGDDSAAETAPVEVSAGPAADLSFSAETVQGQCFEGAQLLGTPAVLWFWAPWCPTCRAQAPGVSRLAQEHEGELTVVGVGGLADPDDITGYAQQVQGPVHLLDPEGAVWRHFGVTAQSSYLVLDAQGRVVSEGYLDDQVLAETVAELVG